MQEAAFSAAGLKAYYLVLELGLSSFKKVMKDMPHLAVEGFNVTVPYKETVIPYLDILTPEARAVGAVNTVFRQGKKWTGTNTDVYGFLTSLKTEGKFLARGKKILILGAGGSARAVAYGLASQEAKEILLANRHPERAVNLIRKMKPLFPKVSWKAILQDVKQLKPALQEAALVVNATSVGLKAGDASLIPASWIPGASAKHRILFFDLIYRPALTPLLKAAKSKGHKAVNGLGMLLFQGAKAFEIWTGKKAPVPVMKKALEASL